MAECDVIAEELACAVERRRCHVQTVTCTGLNPVLLGLGSREKQGLVREVHIPNLPRDHTGIKVCEHREYALELSGFYRALGIWRSCAVVPRPKPCRRPV